MFNDQTYTTPEGFDLYKPLLFPEVRDFNELFTVEGEWDFETMNHRNGYPQAATPEPLKWEQNPEHREVGRFLSMRFVPGPGAPHLFVTPTQMLLDRIWNEGRWIDAMDDFAFFDRVEFEAIYHPGNDRVLIVASASSIIASRWLAYVDPATVPGLAEAVRDG